MTETLTDHERRCRELDRAFARYGMGRSEAEYFQSLLNSGERLIGLWRARGPLAPRRPDRNQMGNPRPDRETQE
jgi:hypothetical protein